MPAKLPTAVLDIAAIGPGMSFRQALFDTIEIAQKVESLGYSRYWLAEHHGDGTAQASPILMAGFVAGITEEIRVGTAAVLLPVHSPLRVANDFLVLESFYPGRIDLGFGAGGVPLNIARALVGRPLEVPAKPEGVVATDPPYFFSPRDEYHSQVAELLSCIRGTGAIKTMPRGVGCPQPWCLGSGGLHSASLAARHGTGFGLALFFKSPDPGPQVLHHYREEFQPSEEFPTPRCSIAIAGVCAETEARANELMNAWNNPFFVPAMVGTPRQCRDVLRDIQRQYNPDELVFLALCRGVDDLVECYRNFARALES